MDSIKSIISKLNECRKNINMEPIIFSDDEIKSLEIVSEKIDNNELLLKVLKGYYFNNSLMDYLKDWNCIIDFLNNKSNAKEKNSEIKEKQSLKVSSNNLLKIIDSYFDKSFKKQNNCFYLEDNSIGVIAMASKYYEHPSYKYWYGLHDYQQKEMEKYKDKFILFYFKDTEEGIIVPMNIIDSYSDKLGKTIKDNTSWIHIHIQKINNEYFLRVPYEPLVPLKEFKLKEETVEVIKISSEYKYIDYKRKQR